MKVKQLIKILQEMPEEALITIGEDYDVETNVVTLMRKHITGANPEVITTVNIDI